MEQPDLHDLSADAVPDRPAADLSRRDRSPDGRAGSADDASRYATAEPGSYRRSGAGALSGPGHPVHVVGSERTSAHDLRRHEQILAGATRSEEHTSELQSLMRISYAVFCLKKKQQVNKQKHNKKTDDK